MPTAPRDRSDFKVAIICALPLEAENVQSVLDKCWEDEDKQYSKAGGDQNTYTTGVIGKYNVVLVHMPSMGSTSAALSAAGLRSSFPRIQLALVVGICGVVPVHPTTKKEIVLGDIVISTAVVQYDFGRQYPGGFQRKKNVEDSLSRANPEIRSFVNMLKTRQSQQRFNRKLQQLIHSKDFQNEVPAAEYPGAVKDRLYEASYIHQHRSDVKCEKCHIGLETCSRNCDELECEDAKLITRNRHTSESTELGEAGPNHTPSIHLGRFGSANTVMKSGMDRDHIAAADEVIAFEMEGAGVWEQHPTVVIKAACDYADSHKNKEWQDYAAAMAAACLKVFLTEWIIPDEPADRDKSSEPIFLVPFNRLPGFIGRTDQLLQLKQRLFEPNSSRTVSILGLGGVGKSRLALELVYQIKSEHPNCSILWIHAADQLTFENDVLEVGKKLRIPGIEDDKADPKALVKQRLSNPSTDRWLLVLDNADDEAVWGKRSNPNDQKSTLVGWLPSTTNGSILITTRSRRVASFLTGKEVTELHTMSVDEANKMFLNALEDPEMAADQTAMTALLDKLTYLPLAITQAASYINMTQETVNTYLELMDEPEEEVIELLSEDFGDQTRYPSAHSPVAITWLVSFEQIRQYHPLAAQFLSSMACLHEKNIPLSLLPDIGSKKNVVGAIAILTGYSFVVKRIRDSVAIHHEALYDMHRLVHLAARNWLKKEGTLPDLTKSCITRVAQLFPTGDYKHKSTWTVYQPHAQRLCEDSGVDTLERCQLLEKMGLCLLVDGKYNDAVKAHDMVAVWREQQLGPSDEQTLEAYNNLGEALTWQGKLPLGETYLRKAVDGLVSKLGESHPSTLSSMANLASTFWNQGRWTQAEELEVQVMETRKRVLGAEHPNTLTSVANLASTYRNQGRWTQAEELFVQVMETRKRVLGAEHPDTLTSMANLASTYRNQGRWTQAEELFVQVMETSSRVLGAEHPNTLTSMNNLAFTIHGQGKNVEAVKLMTECVQLRIRVLGAEHPNTLSSSTALAEWQS